MMTRTPLQFDFMGKRKIAVGFSLMLLLVSLASLVSQGLNYGLDFTGGTLVEVEFSQPADLTAVREKMSEAGYQDVVLQAFGSDREVLIRVSEQFDPHVGEAILAVLEEGGEPVELKRTEFVGAQVGEELREQGGLGLLMALGLVMLYVAFRFQYKFSVGAVVALAHDVMIVLGCFSLFGWDFDLTVLAALLAVIGYSLNDTIVVSDRIRENFRKVRKGTPVQIINLSLNQMLGRTIMTSLTTALVLVALFVFGGDMIHNFATALLIGIAVGTYSSIYVAANILLWMDISKEDLMLPVKEGAEQEEGRL